MIKSSGIQLTIQEIENILIFGDIRGSKFLDNEDPNLPDEFTDFEILKELF